MSTVRYTHGHHESVLRSHRTRTAENSAGYLLHHLRSGLDVLDVGSGPGTITAELAELVAPGTMTAVENTDAALDLTRAELTARGIGNASFAVADVQALSFDDDTFDVVHAHQVLQHLGDPVGALREMGRVCRPGGIVAVRDADYRAFSWFPEVPELDEWLALYRAVARSNGAEPDAGRRLLSWALAAGFDPGQIEPTASVWLYADPAGRADWGGMWADRVLASSFADQAVASGRAGRDDLQRISDAWRRWAAAPDGWLLVPHGELVIRVA
ncbi:class I SAM-dependent methyltransferase [Nakamurella lactea]|uniref:class I SAM-dependent methyltransferase n=1 Tax=Nakamurella lactea TaxID=459515 RepID=UPI0003FC1D00|nr:methyltransferase domain-containing protein [Nakamurella lactea]